MKHAFLDVPDTSPTFYALCAVLLLELLAMGPLRNYVDRPETLPPTAVPCRHTNALCEPHAVQSSMPSPGEPSAAVLAYNAVGGEPYLSSWGSHFDYDPTPSQSNVASGGAEICEKGNPVSDEFERAVIAERNLLYFIGAILCICAVACGYVIKGIVTPRPATEIVTNTVTRTVQTPDYFEIGWQDGVFWGALAVAKGATNLMDAETKAMAMRAEAQRINQQHKAKLQSNLSNIVQP